MKKNEILTYPAIFTLEDNQYWVQFIDFPSCFSDGKTLADAIENSKEALCLYLEDKTDFPECTTNIKNIELKDNQLISFVSIDLGAHKRKYENKSIKKTLSIPAWLNTMAEKNNINFSQVLQEALKIKLGLPLDS